MKYEEKVFDKIEDYLKGKLSSEEKETFEKEMETDHSLKEMVDLHRFEHEAMEYIVQEDLRQRIKDWEANISDKDRRKDAKRKFWVIIFSIAALGISILMYFFTQPPVELPIEEEIPAIVTPEESGSKNDSETIIVEEKSDSNTGEPRTDVTPSQETMNYLALAESSYSVPENLKNYVRGAAEEESILAQMAQLFSKEDYKGVIDFREKIQQDTLKGAQLELAEEYLAHAYFHERQYTQAAELFRSIANQSLMTRKDRAEWYAVLSLLPDYKNQKDTIDTLLAKMIDPQSFHSYRPNAIRLREKLQ